MASVNGKYMYIGFVEVETFLQKSVDESVEWLRMNKFSVDIDNYHVILIP